ncbi:MAG: type II secretion system inner membrane protein GspF [Candidatus Hydrogenedentes bacterium]|nr:type II secretion system inner membrane protein GspF [Candidatus Hydrogenedentota bacterium]
MAVFHYEVLTETGEALTGIVDADTAREAREKLRRRDYYITAVKPVEKRSGTAGKILPAFLRRRRLEEITVLSRQFATLVDAGIPVAEALSALIEQADTPQLETVLRRIKEKVSGGSSLADALGEHPGYFNDLYINMVRAGETSGNLDTALSRLAAYTQRQYRLRGKVAAALAYPVIMTIVAIGVVIFLLLYVIPKVEEMLISIGKPLPLPTKILVGISSFVVDFWWAGLLVVAAGYIGLRIATLSDKGRLMYDRALLRIPVFGSLFRKQAVSRFAITFSTLLASGIPVLQALGIVKRVVDNKVLENTIDEVHGRIMAGTDISTPIKKSGVFPPVVGYMIGIGEESGRLEDMLEKVSDAYDEELEITTQKMTSVLEPIMILVLAVVVGFIVLSAILPIMEIASGM